MTVGTPGFVSERLTEARESLGLTKVALSELIDVTPMAISQYESGTSPRPEILDQVGQKLGFPRSFFLRAPLPDDDAPIFWRSNAAATKIARQRGLQRLKWSKEIASYLTDYFEFPKVDFPDELFSDVDFRELTTADVEGTADRLRQFWGFGQAPVPDLLLELENSGTITGRINMAAETLDAFSQWSTSIGIPFVLVGRDRASAVRSRFDAAHELGHLLLHRNVDRKRINSKEDFNLIEKQAHRFAAAFLLPARAFADELWTPSLDGFLALKERWRVSISMMIMRCETIGITEKEETQRLYINYNRRGWRTEEPLDSVLKHEEPKILKRSFEALIQEGIKSRQQIIDDLALPTREVEQLAGLPTGFFSASRAEVKAFPALKESVRAATSEGLDNVVNLFNREKPSH
ncbi:MAG: XRE family transcriptional regulator [Pseudomonadota bacterium]|nr:XRE family transcriptional regulator [Pseudomonadota bacterium]